MTPLLQAAGRYAELHADATGLAQTPIAGLSVVRVTEPSGLLHAVARPMVCMVLQGSKHVATGRQGVSFATGDSLLISADVPTVSQVTRASAAAPYLSLVLELDPVVIAELALSMAPVGEPEFVPVRVEPTDKEVAEAVLRLMRLLGRPAALKVLQAPLVREIHYWLLAGRHGPAIRRLGWPNSHVQRVARDVTVLRAEFTRAVPVERLADVAAMSPSSFHRHFRAVTSLSPRQFQKHLRLIEARRLMVSEGAAASSAAFAVGYSSVPQFTREYGRMFGVSPVQDAKAARRDAQAVARSA